MLAEGIPTETASPETNGRDIRLNKMVKNYDDIS